MFRMFRRHTETLIEDWQTRGLIDQPTSDALRADVRSRASSMDFSKIVAIVGAVTLGFGAISFVAANWSEMSKLVKIALLFAAMWSAYGVALMAERKHATWLREAMVLLGCGLFGANIFLVAQIFNIPGKGTGALALWGAGSLLAAFAVRSAMAGLLGLALFTLWMGWRTTEFGQPEFLFALPLIAAIASFWRSGWSRAFDFVALSASAWIITFGVWQNEFHPTIVIAIGAVALSAAAFADLKERLPVWMQAERLTLYAFAIYAIGVTIWQVKDIDDFTWTVAGISLMAFLAVSAVAAVTENNQLMVVSVLAVCAQLILIYSAKIANLMNTAAFFTVTGLLLLAMAFALQRLYRRWRGGGTPNAGALS